MELPQGWFDWTNILTYRRLVSQVPEGGIFVEMGCWKGRSICSVADIIIKRNLKVYCVDTFKGAPDEGDAYKEAEEHDIYQDFQDNIKAFGIFDYIEPLVMKTKTATEFTPNDIDLLFIDADHHYPGIKEDLDNWADKVEIGGVIAGHDYYRFEVMKALHETIWPVEIEGTIWFKTMEEKKEENV